MTVKELKEALAAYPDDMEVMKERMDGDYLYDDAHKVYLQEIAGKTYVIIE